MNKVVFKIFYGVFACLLGSGLLFAIPFYAELYFDIDFDVFPARGLMMQVHGAASIIILFLLGCVWQGHSSKKIKKTKSRVSGLLMLSCFISLALTGYLLYYSGSEAVRELGSLTHTGMGLIVVGIIVAHIFLAQSRAARRRLVNRGDDLSVLRSSRNPI